jgi:hypothetical protein
VITVAMENGTERFFAAGLESHTLNEAPDKAAEAADGGLDDIVEEHGPSIEAKLGEALRADSALVRIAGRWFPRGLLIEVSEGQLNLAEAVLDLAQGEPKPTSALLKDVDCRRASIPSWPNSHSTALQDVGATRSARRGRCCGVCAAGPKGRQVPTFLQYARIEHDLRRSMMPCARWRRSSTTS